MDYDVEDPCLLLRIEFLGCVLSRGLNLSKDVG
jgi:hypothetical protein